MMERALRAWVLTGGAVLLAAGAATVLGQQNAITGTTGDDALLGTPGPDRILGLEGADVIEGGDGDDYLEGGPGADEIFAGGGFDVIEAVTGRSISCCAGPAGARVGGRPRAQAARASRPSAQTRSIASPPATRGRWRRPLPR